jgi:hypothetical protein
MGHRPCALEQCAVIASADAHPDRDRRALTLAAALAAATPTLASTIRAVNAGIVPNGDRAIIATRAYDVLGAHPPLVGQYSASTLVVGRVVHSPGPLLYWLLALPARYGGPSSLAVTMGLVNALAIVACVVLARRRGGVALMLAVALALIFVSRSFSVETLHDIWNPSAGLFPFTLLLFCCWSLACGEYRLLALTALTASFAIQSELMFLAPSGAVLAIGFGGLAVWRRRARRPRRMWPWALAGVLVLALCWSAPLLDQIEHSPGNLTLLARAAQAHEPKQGAAVGWHALVRAVGIPPWWLSKPSNPFSRFAEVRSAPGTLSVVSALVLLGALLLVAALALRRREADLASGALIGLALCATLAAIAAFTPTRPSLQTLLGYTMWWGSQAGMWVWLMLGLAAARALRASGLPVPAAGRLASVPLARIALPAALAAALTIGALVAGAQGADQDGGEYRPIATIDARVAAALAPGERVVRVEGSHDFAAFDYRAALLYALRRRGLRVLAPAAAVRLSSYYEEDGVPYDATVYLTDSGRLPRGRVLARVALSGGRTLTVTLVRPASSARHRASSTTRPASSTTRPASSATRPASSATRPASPAR